MYNKNKGERKKLGPIISKFVDFSLNPILPISPPEKNRVKTKINKFRDNWT